MTRKLDDRHSVLKAYREIHTPAALDALEGMAPLNQDRRELIARPIARKIVANCVTNWVKLHSYFYFFNLSLDNHDLTTAKFRIKAYFEAFERDGTRIKENLDFNCMK